MDIKQHIQNSISEILKNNYQIENLTLEVQQNKTDFEGDFTVVIFPLVKLAKKSPDVLGNELGEELKKQNVVEVYNVVKGFLNLSVNNFSFVQNFKEIKVQFDVKENKNIIASRVILCRDSSKNSTGELRDKDSLSVDHLEKFKECCKEKRAPCFCESTALFWLFEGCGSRVFYSSTRTILG